MREYLTMKLGQMLRRTNRRWMGRSYTSIIRRQGTVGLIMRLDPLIKRGQVLRTTSWYLQRWRVHHCLLWLPQILITSRRCMHRLSGHPS